MANKSSLSGGAGMGARGAVRGVAGQAVRGGGNLDEPDRVEACITCETLSAPRPRRDRGHRPETGEQAGLGASFYRSRTNEGGLRPRPIPAPRGRGFGVESGMPLPGVSP